MDAVLVIDIGNTSTSWGLYARGRITRIARLDTVRCTKTAIQRALASYRFSSAVLASVVPAAVRVWRDLLRVPVLAVNPALNLDMPIRYPRPATIGADRIANACGAVARYGTPVIVADFGTAVTFDVVTRKHGYVGGVIAPGLPLMFSYLSEKTAKLPHIAPGPVRGRIGRSTESAMRLGARWGYRGMVREILGELLRHSDLRQAQLVATGGYAGWVVQGLKPRMIVDPDLTLYGLGRIHDLNREHRT